MDDKSSDLNIFGKYIFAGAIGLASFLWAVSFLIRKVIAIDAGVFTVTALSSFFAFIFLLSTLKFDWRKLLTSFRICPFYLLLNSFLSVSIGSAAMFIGLSKIDLTIAEILEKMQPAYTIFLGYLFLRERHGVFTLAFSGLAIVLSILMIQLHYHYMYWVHGSVGNMIESDDWIGWFAITIAALAWSASGLLGRVMSVNGLEAKTIASLRVLLGGAIILPLAGWEVIAGETRITYTVVFACVAIGIIGGGLGYVLYYYGLKKIEAGTASIIELVTPISGILLGILVLGESLSFWTGITMLGLIACVTIVGMPRNASDKPADKSPAG